MKQLFNLSTILTVALIVVSTIFGQTSAEKQAVKHLETAVSHYSKGEHDKAIAELTEAIKLNPKYTTAYGLRAEAYEKKGDFNAAIADYSKMIELEPQNGSGYHYRAKAYISVKNLAAAYKDFTKAIEIAPKDALSYTHRGSISQVREDYEAAVRDYTKAIELEPEIAVLYEYRAQAYGASGKTDLAIADKQRAAELRTPKENQAPTKKTISKDEFEKQIAEASRLAGATFPRRETSKMAAWVNIAEYLAEDRFRVTDTTGTGVTTKKMRVGSDDYVMEGGKWVRPLVPKRNPDRFTSGGRMPEKNEYSVEDGMLDSKPVKIFREVSTRPGLVKVDQLYVTETSYFVDAEGRLLKSQTLSSHADGEATVISLTTYEYDVKIDPIEPPPAPKQKATHKPARKSPK